MGSILPDPLANIFAGWRLAGGSGTGIDKSGRVDGNGGGRGRGRGKESDGSSSGTTLNTKNIGPPRRDMRLRVHYYAHLPALYLQDGEN